MSNNETSRDAVYFLCMAAKERRIDVVQFFIEKGLDKNASDNNGRTALLCAAENGHMDIVQLLVEQGVDKDKTNNNGASPLFITEKRPQGLYYLMTFYVVVMTFYVVVVTVMVTLLVTSSITMP